MVANILRLFRFSRQSNVRARTTVTAVAAMRLFSSDLRSFANDEFVDVAEYPPIEDLTYRVRRRKKLDVVHNEVRDCRTVEEKQIKINMPRYYGFKVSILDNERFPYNCLDFHQHITRTHIITGDKLPSFYDQYEVGEDLLKTLRSDFEEFLAKEHHCFKNFIERSDVKFTEIEKDDMFGDKVVKGINRILINRLAAHNQHLRDIQIDLNPRHEAFWNVGGINIPKTKKKKYEKIEHLKEFANDPIDRSMQFRGKPILALRHRYPLRTVSDRAQLTTGDVHNFLIPFSRFDPATIGYSYEHRHATNIPGFWPGEEHEFALLSYQKQGFLINRTFDAEDNLDALKAHGILTAFSWLSALANYQGFTTFNDVTYSTVSQNVCTNGQKWSFFVYEMNTMLMILEHIYENPKRNICWAGPLRMKLYDEIDSSGKVTGLNDEVIKTLCKLYMNRPEERVGENLKPYLAEEQFVANYQDEDKRQWLEREYKHLMANKELSDPGPEIHNWEKIYKIDHKKRQHEALMRPFEIGQNMYSRRLNDRDPVYWPKALRPHGNRKPRFYKDYFP